MANHVSDAALLDRFVKGREEAAFETLVCRHGTLVRAACRRILSSEHDAEDVVQATFLILALKAPEIAWRDSIGGWLAAVARRLALNARAGACRRRRLETPLGVLGGGSIRGGRDPLPEDLHPLEDPDREVDRRELRRVIDDELNLLPEKYRDPVVLCDLEGLTHAEAARRLGLPTGSMSRRLGRARALLRRRLAGKGLPVAVVVVALAGVAVGLWTVGASPRTAGQALTLRQPTATVRHAGLDLAALLERTGSAEPTDRLRDEWQRLAERSVHDADRLAAFDPGRDRDRWRADSGSMRRSAVELAAAALDRDTPEVLAAARRLDASCVHCHLAFRQ